MRHAVPLTVVGWLSVALVVITGCSDSHAESGGDSRRAESHAGSSTPQSSARETSHALTFHRDIAPIVFDHCAACHRPEGSAPFSLLH
ncbi:MAG TPA: hypothetical protein VKB78_06355, partial [Pirellulales bacterium]|nr:hypothetical protein [Pirellulales bacterium]